MKVVVTGGAGFIGSHVCDALLKAGHDVTVVDDFSSGRNANLEEAFELAQRMGLKFRIVRASISQEDTWTNLEAADAIVHLAAQTSVTASVHDSKKDFEINVLPTQYIISWVRRYQVRMVVYANTAGAMYGKTSYYPTDERAAIRPLSPYGATKNFFEIYLSSICEALKASQAWSSQPKEKNYFSWTSLRLSNVYGPRQITKGEAGVIPIFVETLGKSDAPTIFGDGSKTRDYIHVSDVVSAVMMSLEKMQQTHLDEGFNIATSIETRDIELFEFLVHTMHEIGSDPDSRLEYRNSLKINQPKFSPVRPGEVLRSVMDINKAAALLGWKPRVTFHKGLVETVSHYYEYLGV